MTYTTYSLVLSSVSVFKFRYTACFDFTTDFTGHLKSQVETSKNI